MSGGFFRGTSADQDTRFSNKQAKLLKTQKFASELDHLVDMTKVKMDVMKPWIATRVTELLGFEDEVLINFIYGLLEGKNVNGKEVQISLTGFMEKHTAKFMKELWTLLLSAQKNASGVPQQFLDAKEEETRKKKLETDRIANELQKNKEKESRELDLERSRNMDGAVEMKAINADSDKNSKALLEKDSSSYPKDEKEAGERNGVRGRSRDSPSRSISKSHSNSRSYSEGKSRSISRSPKARRRSISPRRRSVTPRRRHSPQSSRSPPRRSSYFRRRSRSLSPRRSTSPLQHRLHSPRRKSPSPVQHRRSSSPVRHLRSPSPARHHRSPSPFRRRRSPSPFRRRRSPSPFRRRRSPSPFRRRRSPSPFRRRRSPSPFRRRRSPAPVRHRRSPSPTRRRRSPSPVRRRRSPSLIWRRRSPLHMRRASPSPIRRRSPSPTRHWSPSSPMRRRSPSLVLRQHQRSPLTPHRSPSPIGHRLTVPSRLRSSTSPRRRSPSPYASISPSTAQRRICSPVRRKSPIEGRRSAVHSPKEKNGYLRSPQLDPKDKKDLHKRESAFYPSPERLLTVSEASPRLTRKRSTSEDRRSFSPDESPVRQIRERIVRDGSISPSPRPREQRTRQDGPETSKVDKETNRARADGDNKSVPFHGRSVRSSTVSKQRVSPVHVRNKKDHSPGSVKLCEGVVHPETFEGGKQRLTNPGGSKISERNHSHKNSVKDSDGCSKSENATVEDENVDQDNKSDSFDSGSDESDKHKAKIKERRKHKKHDRKEVASDDGHSYDSEIDKKEAKRRKKEEKKLRREEKHRRRDERRRRKEERRAVKLKMRNQSGVGSDDEHLPRRENHPSGGEESEAAQKRLEIELRNKALESIKAKKNSSR